MSRIAVVGTGYVGLVTAACCADLGNDVVGMDVDADAITVLRQGRMPFYEPGLAGGGEAQRGRRPSAVHEPI